MGEVYAHATVSLDGFMAGPNDEMDFVSAASGPNPVVDELVGDLGAVVMGRHTYDVAHAREPFGAAYGGAWKGPHIVLTHEAPAADTVPQGHSISFRTDGIVYAVSAAKEAAGAGKVCLIGGNVACQALAENLVDEIVVHVVPVVLGSGIPFLAGEPGTQAALELVPTEPSEGIANLRYRVLAAST
jgi:dihydrofolate reductase